MNLVTRAGLLTLAISLASGAAHANLGTIAFIGGRWQNRSRWQCC